MLARLKFEISGLVRTILNQVNPGLFESSETTFLDPAMGGGQFIFETIQRLKDQGHSNANIKSRVFGYESNILYVNYIKELYFRLFKEEIPATLSVGGLDELESLKMRFDLVMGNPPYQSAEDNSKRKKFWVLFAVKSLDLLKDSGILAFITPNAWKNPTKYYSDLFEKIRGSLIAVKNCNDSFPGIGEDIGYWIYSNDQDDILIDLGSEPIHRTIYKKMQKPKGEKWHYRDFDAAKVTKKYTLSENRTEEFSVPVYWSASQELYARPSEVKYFGWKVIVNNSGYYPRSIDDKKYCQVNITHATGMNGYGIKVNSEQEGYNVLSWVTSKLYRVIINKMKTGGFNGPFIELKYLGTNKNWTDEELYAHFGLTEEEIEYIESQVK